MARLVFGAHAIRPMFERQIREEDVRWVLAHGETIEDYPDDLPYPSRLVLGRVGGRLLHVVSAHNDEDDEIVVVTVYEPDPAKWDDELRRRSK